MELEFKMKFKYLDKVKVTDGFFAGATGEILDIDPADWFALYFTDRYYVALDPHSSIKIIAGKYLEALTIDMRAPRDVIEEAIAKGVEDAKNLS